MGMFYENLGIFWSFGRGVLWGKSPRLVEWVFFFFRNLGFYMSFDKLFLPELDKFIA